LSRGDWISLAATLISIYLAYRFGGGTAAVICGVVGVCITVVVFLTRKRQHEQQAGAPMQVSQTASPSFTADPTLNANPVTNIYVGSDTRPGPAASQPEGKGEEPARADLVQIGDVLLEADSRGAWVEIHGHRSTNGVILEFQNIPKEIGKRTPSARAVMAALQFASDDGQQLYIDHGTWLNEYVYSTDMRAGQTRKLLVAVKGLRTVDGKPVFSCVDNPRSISPFAARYSRVKSIMPTNPRDLPSQVRGSVLVTLIDGHGVTLFSEAFDYRIEDGNIRLSELGGREEVH